MRKASSRFAVALIAAGLVAACGGEGPTTPTHTVQTQSGGANQPPPNNLPVIDSITIEGTRPKEPSNYAKLGETVVVSANVHDDETPADQLKYVWEASVGTVEGTGASVAWRAPASAETTPTDVALTLHVIEQYGASLDFQQEVTASATLSMHDEEREVADMAEQFLREFSDSRITDVNFIMRNFTDTTKACKDGKHAETNEVAQNRIDYDITGWFVGRPVVTVKFSTLCPYRLKGADACAQVAVDWTSTRLTSGGTIPRGGVEHVKGTDQVTAIYVPDQKKWGLCESDFDGQKAFGSTFIR
jgi:hypothetical protein